MKVPSYFEIIKPNIISRSGIRAAALSSASTGPHTAISRKTLAFTGAITRAEIRFSLND